MRVDLTSSTCVHAESCSQVSGRWKTLEHTVCCSYIQLSLPRPPLERPVQKFSERTHMHASHCLTHAKQDTHLDMKGRYLIIVHLSRVTYISDLARYSQCCVTDSTTPLWLKDLFFHPSSSFPKEFNCFSYPFSSSFFFPLLPSFTSLRRSSCKALRRGVASSEKQSEVWFPCHYQRACFPSFPHKRLVGRWHAATTNASLCSSSRWVIYAWRWAPKAPPSLCRLPSARLGPRWDINPSQPPPPTPANKQTFSFSCCFLCLEIYPLCVPLSWAMDWFHLPVFFLSLPLLSISCFLAWLFSRNFWQSRTEDFNWKNIKHLLWLIFQCWSKTYFCIETADRVCFVRPLNLPK